jgi:hypothetical protein
MSSGNKKYVAVGKRFKIFDLAGSIAIKIV